MKIGRTNLCEQITDAEALPNRVAVTWDHDGFRPLTQTERILSAESPQGTVDERFFPHDEEFRGLRVHQIRLQEIGRASCRERV